MPDKSPKSDKSSAKKPSSSGQHSAPGGAAGDKANKQKPANSPKSK